MLAARATGRPDAPGAIHGGGPKPRQDPRNPLLVWHARCFIRFEGESSMNARAHQSPETRESATESCLFAGGSSVAVGACLCGTVHYAVDRPLETLSHYSDPAW